MSEFIEVISPNAKAQIDAITKDVQKLADLITQINTFKPSSTPSGADKGSLALAEAYKKREEQMDKARIALQKLSDAEAKAVAQKKAQMTAMWDANDKATKKLDEQERAYNKLLAKQKQATNQLRDLVTESNKAENASKDFTEDINKQKNALDKLNAELLEAEHATKKYAFGASSSATPVLAFVDAQNKALEVTKKVNAENEKFDKLNRQDRIANAKAIGVPSDELNQLNAYYRELEKTSASEAKSAMANQNLNRAYVELTARREKAKNKLQDYIAEETRSNAEIRKAQKEFDVLNKKVAAADKAVGKFSEANSKINGLSRSVGNLMTAFGVSTGLYLFASIAKDIYQVTKQLQSLDLALKMVSGSQEEFANNQSFLTNLAEQYGIEIKGLTKNFTEFWVASKGKLEAEQIKAIFTSISKSVAVMGLSVEQQDSAFLALQQMMSKGTVQAEELKKQLGNALPGAVKAATMAYQALHPEMKITEKYFMEQMKAGKVLSSELLPELAKAYEKLYGIENVKRAETLQAAQERLQNSWTELVRSMNESKTGGISTFFKTIIDGATSAMESIGWLNDDWDKLLEKAMGEGRAKGDVAFEKAFMKNVNVKSKDGKLIPFNEIGKDGDKAFLENAKGQLTEEQIILKVLNESRKKHIELKAEELKLRIEWQRLVDEGNDPVGTKRKLERLFKEIGTIETVIGIARERAGLDKASPKTTQNGTTDTKAQIEADAKAKEKRLKAIEEALKTEYDLKMAQLDQDKIILEQGLENEKLNYSERLNFAYLIAAKELEIADTKYKEEQRLLDFKYSDEKEVSKQHKDELLIADINYWKDKEKIAKEAIKRIQDVQFKPQYERQQLADPEKYGEGVGVLGESQTQDMVNLWQKGQDKIKETEEDRIKRLKALRDVLNDVFQEFGQATGFESTMDMFAVIGKNGEDFWTNLTDKKKISEIEWNEWGLAITTVAQDAMNVIDQADEERYQRRLERLEKDKETALKYAGDSAAAKEKIEAQYEKKRKALEVKEFKRKQKMAMANIAIDTAQAIMAVIAKSGQPWMSVVVGALGAVQLAMVASQKPPEYWKGTDNAEAGLAWTQERGAEIVLDKHDRIKSFGSDSGAQLTMMEGGETVIDAKKSKKIMFDNGLNSILSNNGIKEAKIEIVNKGLTVDEMDMVIGKHFANIQTNHTSFDQRGIQQWSEKNGNRTIRNANRGSGIGFRV